MQQWFLDTFRGNEHTSGRFVPSGAARERDGKAEGKSFFVDAPLDLATWAKHLAGEEACGPVPIFEQCMCVFGALDVDDYTLSTADLVERLKKTPGTFVVTRSKSGGHHAWLFTTEPVDALVMRNALQALAARAGLGTVEIFPKQVMLDPGNRGSYINAPYFGNTRKCIENGVELDAEHFRTLVEQRRVTPEKLVEWAAIETEKAARVARAKKPPKERALFSDGPPCLERIFSEGGPPEGTRNLVSFNLAAYLKSRNPDKWREELIEILRPYFSGTFTEDEVRRTAIKSVANTDYRYTCKQSPLKDFCASKLCRLREHGVGIGDQVPEITDLLLRPGEAPVYRVFLDGFDQPIEMSPSELITFYRFESKVLGVKPIPMPSVKAQDWKAIVNDAMTKATIEQLSDSAKRDALGEARLIARARKYMARYTSRSVEIARTHGVPFRPEGTRELVVSMASLITASKEQGSRMSDNALRALLIELLQLVERGSDYVYTVAQDDALLDAKVVDIEEALHVDEY